jgi:hypothetical protein
MKEPIIIVGTPRSGTSMVAGIFDCHGVFTGKCRQADGNNPKGYFENTDLTVLRYVNLLHRDAVAKILRKQGYVSGNWLVKHTPRYWRRWSDFCPKFIKVRRDFDKTLESRIKSGHFEETELQARKTIISDTKIMDRHIKGPNIYADELVKGDLSSLKSAMEYCGIEMSAKKVSGFVDASLWHGLP